MTRNGSRRDVGTFAVVAGSPGSPSPSGALGSLVRGIRRSVTPLTIDGDHQVKPQVGRESTDSTNPLEPVGSGSRRGGARSIAETAGALARGVPAAPRYTLRRTGHAWTTPCRPAG
ncbi:hypothetical protein GCM10022243_25080 [Saccharothrix violaceirubra]